MTSYVPRFPRNDSPSSFVLLASSLATILILISPNRLPAQDVDSLQAAITRAQERSDSLYKSWEQLWKKSDSLRVESMFLRMKSDSLKRYAATLQATLRATLQANLQENVSQTDSTTPSETPSTTPYETLGAHAQTAAAAVRKPTVKKGQTYSDSITADILAIEADTGMASYYAEKFHGKSTSSGEKYNMHDLTCAHRWLPYGTRLRVVNLANGREVIVRVNDRGPFHHSRMIDVSKAAAKELDMIRAGTARVEVRVANP